MRHFISYLCLAAAAGLQSANGIVLDLGSAASIRDAAATAAYALMSFYTANVTGKPEQVGTFTNLPPWYWWMGGAAWGAMIDYWAYTGDTSYVNTTMQALLAQTGPDNNFLPPAYFGSMGNDDQGFWGIAAMSAAELYFPNPSSGPSWLAIARNVFDSMAPRWDTTTCGGGLKWQVFASNAGYDYKNSVSNGAFFQLAARLARITRNTTYSDWAETIFDWTQRTGLIGPNYQVYDGTDDLKNCTELDHTQWSYNLGLYMYGTAVMYNLTNGSTVWTDRLHGLLNATPTFFSPFPNATNIMYEAACEPNDRCNTDQLSFKAYLSRWMSKTSVLAPWSAGVVQQYLNTSALAAAQSCSGGQSGSACGTKWYVGGWDGATGVGQQLSALETFTALLVRSRRTGFRAELHCDNCGVDTDGTTGTVTTETVTTETVASKTVTSQTVTSETVTTEPVPTEPVPTEPMTSETVTTEPMSQKNGAKGSPRSLPSVTAYCTLMLVIQLSLG